MEINEEFFVALGFIVFIALLGYLGVHRKLNAALDERGERIKAEFAEALKLREEAAAVLASFEKRRAEAEAEAEALVAQARAEAEALSQEAQKRIAEFVERRTRQAENKIALAEADATLQVRGAAADAAVKAAEVVLRDQSKGPFGETLFNQNIADLKTLVH
jgi:F-type H+-transporting ATPase subunit b